MPEGGDPADAGSSAHHANIHPDVEIVIGGNAGNYISGSESANSLYALRRSFHRRPDIAPALLGAHVPAALSVPNNPRDLLSAEEYAVFFAGAKEL